MSGGKKRALRTPKSGKVLSRVASFDVPGDTDDAFGEQTSPLLVINPDGSDEALLSSVKARARRLERALLAWSIGDSDEVPARQLAEMLHANAFEVVLMLDEMWRRSNAPKWNAL